MDAVNTLGSVAGANRVVRTRLRFAVHILLLLTLLAAIVPLLIFGLSSRVTIHAFVAYLFVAFVIVHLSQRRKTVKALLSQVMRFGTGLGHRRGLARSDTLFVFLMINVFVSGTFDLLKGTKSFIPGLHFGWHALSSLLLLIYLLAHVIKRRKRIRRSSIS